MIDSDISAYQNFVKVEGINYNIIIVNILKWNH